MLARDVTVFRRRKGAIDVKPRKRGLELHISPGEIHRFDAFTWRPAAREKWRATVSFLKAHAPPA